MANGCSSPRTRRGWTIRGIVPRSPPWPSASSQDLDADVADLEAGLGAQGRAVTALLDNRDPDRVPGLIEGLPEAVRRDLAALDLSRRDLAPLQARLLLVHGRDDPIIPSTESLALAAAAPDDTTLYLVDSLAHVELSPAGLVDGWKLWRAITWLLAERDAAPRPDRPSCREGLADENRGPAHPPLSTAGYNRSIGRSGPFGLRRSRMEITMASTAAAQTRDFARRFLQVVLELGREDWVSANDAFERTITAHPDHPYVAYVQANRARRAGFSAAAERIREQEFPQIERRKVGTRRNAPVFYRTRRPGSPSPCNLNLDLPYRVPPSHPLRTSAKTGSALRQAPEQQERRSPWRRRLAARRLRPDASSGAATLALCWQKLADAALDLVAAVRAIARRGS